jgi:hypothetical protein
MKQKHKTLVEVHSSLLEQAEDRISELEDKMEINGKIEELLDHSRPAKGICKNSLTPSKIKSENHGH